MTNYQKLEDKYQKSGHTAFMLGLGLLITLGREGLQKDFSVENIPGNLFPKEIKQEALSIARIMADTETHVLVAVLQRVVSIIYDPTGEKIPLLHLVENK